MSRQSQPSPVLYQSKWSDRLFYVSIFSILFLTLLPFDFEKPQQSYLQEIYTGFGHHSDPFDLFGNLLLFVPFGFALSGILERRKLGLGKGAIAKRLEMSIAVSIASLALSTTVEILQVFLPERAATSIDLISNTISGILGFLLFYFFKQPILRLASRLSGVLRKLLSFKFGLALFLAYLVSSCFLLSSFREATKLSNWDAEYPLLVGNELTADRPWKGEVSQFCLADRPASIDEVSQLLTTPNTCDTLSSSLIASYTFNGNQKTYPDRLQNLPELISRGTLPRKNSDRSVFVNYKHWLQTMESVQFLTDKLKATSQFTLVTTIASASSTQEGPARIISVSKNALERNFTLGQEGNDLSFRLRTPLTGNNGMAPEIIIPDVFSDPDFHQIVVSYDGWTLKFYIDRPQSFSQLKLSPDAALFWTVMSVFDKKIHLTSFSLWVYKSIYSGIIFVPLGILFAIAWGSYRGNFSFRLLAIALGILLPAFLIEGIIASCMNRALQFDRIGLAIAIESIAFLLTHNTVAAWLRSPVD